MKFTVKNKTGENIGNLMRQLRYHYLGTDQSTGQMNFVRPVGQGAYPRFHIYLKENPVKKEIIFNLHLDQKKPIYPVRKPLSSSGAEDNTEENRYFEKKLKSFKLSNGVYKGVPAHAAEYKGEIVEKEAGRIKSFFADKN